MKLAPWFLAAVGLVASCPASSEACGLRGRCHGHHRRVMAGPACAPAVTTAAPVAAMSTTYGTPQTAQAAAAPSAVVAEPAMAAPAVQPSYEYAAATNGQPAYYYTYDSSGKLIVAQWMDWVFRGGRAAGEPAPPLPIIGNLRNR